MDGIRSEIILENLKILLDDVPRLDNLEKLAINCVYVESLIKLKIINKLLSKPYSEENNSLATQKQNERNKITHQENSLIALKIKNCLCFIIETLSNSISEILAHGTQYYLPNTVCRENLKIYDNYLLRLQHKKGIIELIELKENLKKVKYEFNQACQYLGELNGSCLKRSVTNIVVREKLLRDYKLKLGKTRLQQNFKRIELKEQTIYEFIYNQNHETVEATKVQSEIENYLLNSIDEVKKQLMNWTEKYNKELEKTDTEILQLRNKLDEIKTTMNKFRIKISVKRSLIMHLRETSFENRNSIITFVSVKQSSSEMTLENIARLTQID